MPLDRASDLAASIFDLDRLLATPLATEPFDHLHVPGLIRASALEAANRDYPDIRKPGNYTLAESAYGPGFQAILDALNEPTFLGMMSDKFGVALTNKPTTITMRTYCELSDGDIHTDHWSKVVTLLLYFNADWPHEGGRLRLLRSADDIDDFGVEIPPIGGTMIAFRRSAHSFHGHKRFVGERRMLQLSWLDTSPSAQLMLKFDRIGTRLVKTMSRFRGRAH